MTNYFTPTSDKRKCIAFVLCFFGGMFGLHYFYVGRIARGVLYALTGGMFFVGVLKDLCDLSTGSFYDNVGNPLRR